MIRPGSEHENDKPQPACLRRLKNLTVETHFGCKNTATATVTLSYSYPQVLYSQLFLATLPSATIVSATLLSATLVCIAEVFQQNFLR